MAHGLAPHAPPRGRSPCSPRPTTSSPWSRKSSFPKIERIIAATDAGREGELIFRYIYEAAGCTKPVSRLWISSLTPDAIRNGFRHLRADATSTRSPMPPADEAAPTGSSG